MKILKILLILFLMPKIVLAFFITPARMEVSQKAGEEKEYYFTIKNTRQAPVLIKISVYDFDIDINGKVLIKEKETLPGWIEMPIKQTRIGSNALKKVSFTVQLATATTGEKRAMFYFQEISEGKKAVAIVMRVGSAFYCAVEGTEIIKTKIDNFKIFSDRVSLLFINLGNIHLRPEIILTIRNSSGEIIREITLTKDFPVLPFHTYIIERKFENELGLGNYSAILEINYKEIFERKEIPCGIFKIK